MDERSLLDFISAFSEEFCEVLHPVIGWDVVVPQDAYEVFYRTIDHILSPQLLASLSESQLEQLRDRCEEYFEYQGITVDHIRSIVSNTLTRWPTDG